MTAKKSTKPEGETLEGEMTAITEENAEGTEGLHERLEAAELAMLGCTQEHAQALNRIMLLTGALKTALPVAIHHIDDADLKSGLQALISLL